MIWALAILGLWLTAAPSAPTLPVIPPVNLTGAWTTVPLPAMPLGVAEHNGTLWVCGAEEMIASSNDGGQHWVMRHLEPGGEMLFSFVFGGPRPMEVFGTEGARLASSDGGLQWSSLPVISRLGLVQVELMGKAGFGRAADAVAATGNSGEVWNVARLQRKASGGPPGANYDPVAALAVLDAQHAAALLDGNMDLPTLLVATQDGGRHWRSRPLPSSWTLTGLRASGGVYHLYGDESPNHQPVAADSSDGLTWKAAAAPPAAYGDCTTQGCLFFGGWADLTGAVPRWWQEPGDAGHTFASAWAAAGATLCRTSGELRCRIGQTPWQAPPPHPAAAAVVPGDVQAAMCVSCPAPKYPGSALGGRHAGVVRLHVVIGTDGKINEMVLLGAAAADLAEAAMAKVKTWEYRPLLLKGKAMEVDSVITVSFTLGSM